MKGTVVLIPGWGDPGVEWRHNSITSKLGLCGYETTLFIPKNFGMGDINDSAKRLATLVKKLQRDNERVHLIGHSLGGLVAVRSNAHCSPSSMTTIGTPHRGTRLARFAPWSVGARQMVPNSLLLQANARSTGTPVLSIACSRDALIWPRDSAIHPHSTEEKWINRGHISVMFSGEAANTVVDFIHKVDVQFPDQIN